MRYSETLTAISWNSSPNVHDDTKEDNVLVHPASSSIDPTDRHERRVGIFTPFRLRDSNNAVGAEGLEPPTC